MKFLEGDGLWKAAAGIVAVIWVGSLALFAFPQWGFIPVPGVNNFPEYWAWRGTLGDMFGAANSIFSAIVVIGVAYGIKHQQQEIKEARETAREQAFLTAFVHMLSSFPTHEESVIYKGVTGTNAVAILSKEMETDTARYSSAHFMIHVYVCLMLIDQQPADKQGVYVKMLTATMSAMMRVMVWRRAHYHPSDDLSPLFKKFYAAEIEAAGSLKIGS